MERAGDSDVHARRRRRGQPFATPRGDAGGAGITRLEAEGANHIADMLTVNKTITSIELEGSEVNYFLASHGIVYVELKTFAAHAVLLRHLWLDVQSRHTLLAHALHQESSQADKGRARSSILHRMMNGQALKQ